MRYIAGILFALTLAVPRPVLADDPPSVSFAYPPADTTQACGSIPVEVHASDDIGLTSVKLYDNGVPIYTFTLNGSGIYRYTWNTDAIAEGAHAFKAIATDGGGHAPVARIDVTVTHSCLTIARSDALANGSALGLRADRAHGGADYSLIWGSTQILTQTFGSQMQSTLYLNGLSSQCAVFESGTYWEGDWVTGDPTRGPSPVNYAIGGDAWLQTDITMNYAYPRITLPDSGGCGMEHLVGLHKTETMNYGGMAGVIRHDVAYTTTTTYQKSIPANYNHGSFITLSVNVPPTSIAHRAFYKLSTKTLLVQPDDQLAIGATGIAGCGVNGEDCMPILYNDDGSVAIGVFNPGDVNGTGATSWWTATWRCGMPTTPPCNDTIKEPLNEMQCRHNIAPPLYPGTYKWSCFAIVGSIANVEASMDALNGTFNTSAIKRKPKTSRSPTAAKDRRHKPRAAEVDAEALR